MFMPFNETQNQFYKDHKSKKISIISFEFFGYCTLRQSFDKIQKKWVDKIDYEKIVRNDDLHVIIVDTSLKIVFASEKVSKMNGYFNSEIIGKSPKMFQGENTNKLVASKIRTAINNKESFKEILLNYKKDGTSYFCEIEAYPKFDENGNLLNYIAFERAA